MWFPTKHLQCKHSLVCMSSWGEGNKSKRGNEGEEGRGVRWRKRKQRWRIWRTPSLIRGDVFKSQAHLPSHPIFCATYISHHIRGSLFLPLFSKGSLCFQMQGIFGCRRGLWMRESKRGGWEGETLSMTHGINTVRISAWWKTDGCYRLFIAEVKVCVDLWGCVYLCYNTHICQIIWVNINEFTLNYYIFRYHMHSCRYFFMYIYTYVNTTHLKYEALQLICILCTYIYCSCLIHAQIDSETHMYTVYIEYVAEGPYSYIIQ